jgi:arginine decarboxylase
VLVPGQVIEPAVLAYLARLLQTQKSIELHGLATERGEIQLRVLTEPEAAHLPAFK